MDAKKYPENKGMVRGHVHINGYHLVEHRGPDGIWIDVNFISENDIKIS